jgi:hypothetical protein
MAVAEDAGVQLSVRFGPLPGVDLGLADPATQRLPADAELVGDPGDHAVPLAGLLDGLQHHPDGPLMQLRRVAPLRGVGTVGVSHPHELVDRLEAYAAEQGPLGGH